MRARPGREVRNCGARAAAAERGEPSGGDRAAAGRANALVSGPEDAHDGRGRLTARRWRVAGRRRGARGPT